MDGTRKRTQRQEKVSKKPQSNCKRGRGGVPSGTAPGGPGTNSGLRREGGHVPCTPTGTSPSWHGGTAHSGPAAFAWSPTNSNWLFPPGGGYVNLINQSPMSSPFQQQNPFVNQPSSSPLQQQNPFLNEPTSSQLPENSHFVGGTMSHNTISPSSHAPPAEMESHENGNIDFEDDTLGPSRLEGRLQYTNEEDIRLISGWLEHSIDPIDGNDKKSDQYWSAVTDQYNGTTPANRHRTCNQLKIRWNRIKKAASEFNGCWKRVTNVWESGKSDEQYMELALQMWSSENGGKQFNKLHVWMALRHEKKWEAYLKKCEQEKEKEKGKTTNLPNVVNLEDNPNERPIGQKRAKEERNGKQKVSDGIAAMNVKLDKFIDASIKTSADREKMTEVQEKLANKKVEAAKITHKAAEEQTKCKMLEVYSQLSLAPTDHLTEEALAERNKALASMRSALFGKSD